MGEEPLVEGLDSDLGEHFVGQNFPFRDQKEARKLYMKHIKEQYTRWTGLPKWMESAKSAVFPVCCGAGGIGKTTFVRKALRVELTDPSLVDADGLYELLQSCCSSPMAGELNFRVSFSDDPLRGEDLRPGLVEQSLALRLLHQFVKVQNGEPVKFRSFIQQIDEAWQYHISFNEVLDFIRTCAGIPKDSKCMMILHLDETNVLLENDLGREYLKEGLQVLADLIQELKHTFLVCPLTGIVVNLS